MRKKLIISITATCLLLVFVAVYIGNSIYNDTVRYNSAEEAFTNSKEGHHSDLLKLLGSDDIVLAIYKRESLYSSLYLQKDSKGWKTPKRELGKTILEKQIGNCSVRIREENMKYIIVVDSLDDRLDKTTISDSTNSKFEFYHVNGQDKESAFFYQVWFAVADKNGTPYRITINDETITI